MIDADKRAIIIVAMQSNGNMKFQIMRYRRHGAEQFCSGDVRPANPSLIGQNLTLAVVATQLPLIVRRGWEAGPEIDAVGQRRLRR